MRNIRIRATVLSPVHVWGGQAAQIEPYLYALDGNTVHILSEHRLVTALEKIGELEDYLHAIERGPRAAQQAVARLTEARKIPLQECSIHSAQAGNEFRSAYRNATDTGTPLELYALPRALGGPTLPGSGIKGAMRSALLWSKTLDELEKHNIHNNQSHWTTTPKEPDKDGLIFPGHPRPNDNTSFEAHIFGNLGTRNKPTIAQDPLRAMHVGDSSEAKPGETSIEAVDVWSATPRHPQFERTWRVSLREVLRKNATLEFEVRFNTAFQNHPRAGLHYKPDLEALMQACRDFGVGCAEVDLNFYEQQGRRSKDAQEAAVTTGNILDAIDASTNTQRFPLRLGMGSGRAGTTLVQLFDEKSHQASLSRKLAANQPMGWLMCEVIS